MVYKASVIITTYSRPKFLKRSVESVFAQTMPAEIIVVDDNGVGSSSQIETAKIISHFDGNIRYLPLETNSGACSARNMGAKAAVGEYLFFLDDDDAFLPTKVETQISFLENNPNLDGCLSAFHRIDLVTGGEIKADSNFPRVGEFKDFVINGNFFTPMLCIKRESFLAIGGFDDIPRFQDRYLMLKALLNNQRFAVIEEPLYKMYEHDTQRITHKSISNSFKSLDLIRDRILQHKNLFTAAEWKTYELKELRMRATIFYVAKRYKTRVQAALLFLKAYLKSSEKQDLLSAAKALIKA